MNIHLQRVKIQDLSEEDIQTLRKLTNKGYSTMIDFLPKHQCPSVNKQCCYHALQKSKCVIIARKSNNKIIGWSLLEDYEKFWWSSNDNDAYVHTFVDKEYRRIGVGKILVEEMLNLNKKKKISCHKISTASKKLYNSFARLIDFDSERVKY